MKQNLIPPKDEIQPNEPFLDKLVIIDFLERVKLGTFDIESNNTQRLLLDEMEDFVDVQIKEIYAKVAKLFK